MLWNRVEDKCEKVFTMLKRWLVVQGGIRISSEKDWPSIFQQQFYTDFKYSILGYLSGKSKEISEKKDDQYGATRSFTVNFNTRFWQRICTTTTGLTVGTRNLPIPWYSGGKVHVIVMHFGKCRFDRLFSEDVPMDFWSHLKQRMWGLAPLQSKWCNTSTWPVKAIRSSNQLMIFRYLTSQ
jgi:hypothetical protein